MEGRGVNAKYYAQLGADAASKKLLGKAQFTYKRWDSSGETFIPEFPGGIPDEAYVVYGGSDNCGVTIAGAILTSICAFSPGTGYWSISFGKLTNITNLNHILFRYKFLP